MTARDARAVSDAQSIRTIPEALRVFFSRPGPKILAATAGATWGLRALLGPPGLRDLAAAGAVIAWWPFQEWLLHKYLLHLPPGTVAGRRVDPHFARRHRAHHRNPRDVDRTLLPLYVVLGSIPIAGAGCLMLFGPGRAAATAMATYSTMALVYEWTHFFVHTGVAPRSPLARRVRRNHRLHHYRNERHWFAFTMPAVDRWLGTDPDPATVPVSPTATDLHGLEAARAPAAGSRA